MQLLCDEGEFQAADDLFKARLAEGGYGVNVFKNLPALIEGLECSLAFVEDEDRRQKMAKILGKGNVAFHCAGVALYNYFLGNLGQAREWRYKALELRRQQHDKLNQASSLHEISSIEMHMGNISKAQETVSQAFTLSHETKDLLFLMIEFDYKAYYEFLLGNCQKAHQHFEIALHYGQKRRSGQQSLTSNLGNLQTEFFIRMQAWKQFEAVNASNIQVTEKNHWNDKLAVCRLLQGWYEICRGKFAPAEKALAQAEHVLRPSGMLEKICRLDWVWALLTYAKEDYQKGLGHVNDALLTCADKGFRLWQADHFILRGRLYLLQFQKENNKKSDLVEKAGDDGKRALKIAEDTGYIWAKVDALELLCLYHQTRTKFSVCNSESEKESAQSYRKEANSIKKGFFLTKEQMEELKEQAKKEFENLNPLLEK